MDEALSNKLASKTNCILMTLQSDLDTTRLHLEGYMTRFTIHFGTTIKPTPIRHQGRSS